MSRENFEFGISDFEFKLRFSQIRNSQFEIRNHLALLSQLSTCPEHSRRALNFPPLQLHNLVPSTANVSCGIAGIHHELSTTDEPLVIYPPVIGHDYHRILGLKQFGV